MYAKFILDNKDKELILDWSIADRPPLQIGAVLPIIDFTEGDPSASVANYYNLFAIFLQLSWIAAMWAILQRLKIQKRLQVMLFIGFCATGFFFLNSIFVWPKFLAAALVLAGMTPFIGVPIKRDLLRYLPVALVLISLGMLAHTSVTFTVIPFAFIFLYKFLKAKSGGYKHIALALALALLVLAPWQLYKSSITTSDRLVKYHFADVPSYEDKRGTLETIVQEYRKLTFEQWLHNKIRNIKALGSGDFKFEAGCRPINPPKSSKGCNDWKTLTFFSTFFALEVYALGILAITYQLYRRKLDSFDKESLLIIGASLLFWLIVMFHPGSTVVHQGSYLTMLLIFILLGRNLAKSSPRLLIILTCIQVVIFYNTWIAVFK